MHRTTHMLTSAHSARDEHSHIYQLDRASFTQLFAIQDNVLYAQAQQNAAKCEAQLQTAGAHALKSATGGTAYR